MLERSRKAWRRRSGGAYRRAKTPSARGYLTGPIWNWLLSTLPTMTPAVPAYGHAPADPAHHRRWRSEPLLDIVPKGTPIETLVKVEGHRRAIEDSFETAKNELGFDHNETRSWHGWHRHVSLVMLAFVMTAIIRLRANSTAPQK
jgi:hypothetical protein